MHTKKKKDACRTILQSDNVFFDCIIISVMVSDSINYYAECRMENLKDEIN